MQNGLFESSSQSPSVFRLRCRRPKRPSTPVQSECFFSLCSIQLPGVDVDAFRVHQTSLVVSVKHLVSNTPSQSAFIQPSWIIGVVTVISSENAITVSIGCPVVDESSVSSQSSSVVIPSQSASPSQMKTWTLGSRRCNSLAELFKTAGTCSLGHQSIGCCIAIVKTKVQDGILG